MGDGGSRRPLATFRGYGAFGVQVAVWKAEKGVTFSISKSYRPKDSNEWKESKSFFISDLMALSQLLIDAAGWANEYLRKESESRNQNAAGQGLQDIPESASEDYLSQDFSDEDIPF